MNEQAILEFKKLLEVTKDLMGPQGCPWDREQTLVSMRASVLEEACEVIEAIDEGDNQNLKEELGDLLYNFIFFCELAAKEGRFEMVEAIRHVREKLIARHPHVFGDQKGLSTSEVVAQWERIKKEEKPHRESLLDGIPKGLPALARAYKMAKQMEKAGFETPSETNTLSEEELGERLWELVLTARAQGLQPEHALRKHLVERERAFREWESS